MKILAIETTSNVASVAISFDDKLVYEKVLNHKITHSQTLMPMVEDALLSAGLELCDIDYVAVSAGPGSFTGVRIGVATAKGLAHSCDKPIIGVSTLESMAYNMPYISGLIAPIMDARREQVYCGLYKFENGAVITVKEPCAIPVEQLCNEINEDVVFLGDGVFAYKDFIADKLGDKCSFAPVNLNMQRASSVAALAVNYAQNGRISKYNELEPVYLRKSQAEREYDEKMKEKGE